MLCPKCLSTHVQRELNGGSPAGPLSQVVQHFECSSCRHTFFRANPDLAHARVRPEGRFRHRREAA
jgi:transposase-like protein